MQTTEILVQPSSVENVSYNSEQKRFSLHEDWVVVVLGFLIIGITLFGFVLPVPAFGWKNSEDLLSKVLAPAI